MNASNILVLDPVPFSQRLLGTILKKEGYRPMIVASVDHALDALEADDYTLILLNVDHPDGELFDLVKLSRFSQLGTSYLPAILLTASDRGPVTALTREAGIDAVLVKPVQPQRLLEAVAHLIRAHRPHRRAV
jgi:DNA-binding response OmpR family regulator